MRREAIALQDAVAKAETSYDVIRSSAGKTAALATGHIEFHRPEVKRRAHRVGRGAGHGPTRAGTAPGGRTAATDAGTTNAPVDGADANAIEGGEKAMRPDEAGPIVAVDEDDRGGGDAAVDVDPASTPEPRRMSR